MEKLITITTDFGDQFATAQLHAVIASLGFGGKIIENHSVTPFSIIEGSFQISQLARFTPNNSIHLGVIDPGVGTERPGIVIQTKNFWFVGPDNGLLYPAAKNDDIKHIWRLQESSFGDNIANTFHGRDVFIKAAIYLAQGKMPQAFGCQPYHTSLQTITFSPGQVVHIDHYGNYKIYWPYEILIGEKLRVSKNGKAFILPVVKTFGDVPIQHPLAYKGSNGTLEITTNQADPRPYFGFHLEDVLQIGTI